MVVIARLGSQGYQLAVPRLDRFRDMGRHPLTDTGALTVPTNDRIGTNYRKVICYMRSLVSHSPRTSTHTPSLIIVPLVLVNAAPT